MPITDHPFVGRDKDIETFPLVPRLHLGTIVVVLSPRKSLESHKIRRHVFLWSAGFFLLDSLLILLKGIGISPCFYSISVIYAKDFLLNF